MVLTGIKWCFNKSFSCKYVLKHQTSECRSCWFFSCKTICDVCKVAVVFASNASQLTIVLVAAIAARTSRWTTSSSRSLTTGLVMMGHITFRTWNTPSESLVQCWIWYDLIMMITLSDILWNLFQHQKLKITFILYLHVMFLFVNSSACFYDIVCSPVLSFSISL